MPDTKKDWLIKYGIMGVLAIALMYTTVPLTHMFVIDFDVEDFEYTDTYEIESNYLVDLGMDGFITHELIGNSIIGKIPLVSGIKKVCLLDNLNGPTICLDYQRMIHKHCVWLSLKAI